MPLTAPMGIFILSAALLLSFLLCILLFFRAKRLQDQLTLTLQQRALCEEKIQFLESSQESMPRFFEGVVAKAIQESQQHLLESADRNFQSHIKNSKQDMEHRDAGLKSLISPLQEMVRTYDQQVRTFEQDRERALGALARQLVTLGQDQAQLRQETARLVSALRQPQTRGRWGEISLRRVVEMAGMTHRCDFSEQVSQEGETGRIRPDMVVRLPGGRQIIVDAKVPLSAYLDAMETQSEEKRSSFMNAHARQVAEHVRQLSKKQYWKQFTPTPEFVILFIPGENFFGAALSEKPDLIDLAAAKGVIPATPTTLIALLKTVAMGWREADAAENAEKIAVLGQELYERLTIFAGHLETVGQDLERTVTTYNRSIGSFRRRILPSVRKFEAYGITGESPLSEPEPVRPLPERIPEAAPLTPDTQG